MESESSRNYIKKEENSDALEIYEQIKKQTDELSTSEGSIQFLKNLSNPTNLTNPQIIGYHHSNINNINELNLSKISKEKINKTINRIYKKQINRNIRKEILFSRENNKKYLFENLNKDNDIKTPRNAIKNKNEKNIIDSPKNKTVNKNEIHLSPILDKLYTSPTHRNNNKDIRINKRKNTSKKKYIDDNKEISKLRFNIKNKMERYEKLKKIKKSELSLIDKISEKIENSKKYIQTNYYTKFISYMIFLNRQVEKEKIVLSDLVVDIFKIKKEIKLLNNNIEKLIKKKYNILLWICLQIQIKEKLKQVPYHYIKILEEDDYYKIYNNIKINKLNNINQIETSNINLENENISNIPKSGLVQEKILNYKYNAIYDTVDEFMNQYEILKDKWIKGLNKYQYILKEIEKLKTEYITIIGEQKYKSNQKLIFVKNLNYQLKSDLKKVKSQINISSHKNNKNKPLKTSLSSFDINNEINKNLFSLIMNSFHLIKQNNFVKFENFENNCKKENPILIIMKYIEKIVNLLIDEKKKYYDDPILYRKYKKIENKVKKDNKMERYLTILKIKEAKQKEKIKKIAEKMNKAVYLPTRQIDYSFLNKGKTINKNKNKNILSQENNNRQLSFEDFMYDL